MKSRNLIGSLLIVLMLTAVSPLMVSSPAFAQSFKFHFSDGCPDSGHTRRPGCSLYVPPASSSSGSPSYSGSSRSRPRSSSGSNYGNMLGSQIGSQLLGSFMQGVMNGLMSSDGSGPSAAEIQAERQRRAEEARRRAEEEARWAEEQRQARIRTAARLRIDWDGRDQEMSERLEGVLDVVEVPAGTAFFGIASNPDVTLVNSQENSSTVDSSVVDLRDSATSDAPDALLNSSVVDLSGSTEWKMSSQFFEDQKVRAKDTAAYSEQQLAWHLRAPPTTESTFDWQKVKDGYHLGTGIGLKSAQWYADRYAATGQVHVWVDDWGHIRLRADEGAVMGKLFYGAGGLASSLWTPDTYLETLNALAAVMTVESVLSRFGYLGRAGGTETIEAAVTAVEEESWRAAIKRIFARGLRPADVYYDFPRFYRGDSPPPIPKNFFLPDNVDPSKLKKWENLYNPYVRVTGENWGRTYYWQDASDAFIRRTPELDEQLRWVLTGEGRM